MLIEALLAAMLIASLGHSAMQVSQPVHFSSSTLAGIYTTLSKNLRTYYCSVTVDVLQN
jgi:cytochrome c-type biogenesis protein CcmH/NrfF